MLRGIVSCSLSLLFLVSAERLASDTLFKKTTAVAIGFGATRKADIGWTDCQKQGTKKYVKPPYWVDQSDNCQLKAEGFGLRTSGTGFSAENTDQLSRFFPDVKKGDVVEFKDVSSSTVILRFRGRSLFLPYGTPPSEEQISNNELSMAAGFANVNKYDQSTDLLRGVDAVITRYTSEKTLASADFFSRASASIRDVSNSPPEITDRFQNVLLHLAEYRSALEKTPEIPFSQRFAAFVVSAGPQTYEGNFFDFGGQDKADIVVLQPGLNGRMPQHILFRKDGFRGGRQLLDGIYWDRVTFVRTHIIYRGGLVYLRDLHFVGCSLEVVNSPRGNDFLNFVVNQLPEFMVGTEYDQPPSD